MPGAPSVLLLPWTRGHAACTRVKRCGRGRTDAAASVCGPSCRSGRWLVATGYVASTHEDVLSSSSSPRDGSLGSIDLAAIGPGRLSFAEPDKLAPPAAEGTAEPADRVRVVGRGGSATPFESGECDRLGLCQRRPGLRGTRGWSRARETQTRRATPRRRRRHAIAVCTCKQRRRLGRR